MSKESKSSWFFCPEENCNYGMRILTMNDTTYYEKCPVHGKFLKREGT